MFIIFKKFVLCKYFTNEKLYILNALLISLLQLKLIKKLFYKISLFSYILTPEITYNCCPADINSEGLKDITNKKRQWEDFTLISKNR